MQLLLDGQTLQKNTVSELGLVYRFLDSLPSKIGMTKIAPPYVFSYMGIKPEDWGISGIVFIAENHITIHTVVEKRTLHLDVFSCKDFNAGQVAKLTEEWFGLVQVGVQIIHREMGGTYLESFSAEMG